MAGAKYRKLHVLRIMGKQNGENSMTEPAKNEKQQDEIEINFFDPFEDNLSDCFDEFYNGLDEVRKMFDFENMFKNTEIIDPFEQNEQETNKRKK